MLGHRRGARVHADLVDLVHGPTSCVRPAAGEPPPVREDAPVTDEVRWAAPGRVNLVGEHTDYNDGFVLPFALPRRTTVTARRRDDDVLVLRSAQADDEVRLRPGEIGPGAPPGWAGYAAGVVWALRDAGHRVPGCDLDVDGDVPVGAGLSSSAALSCATALAVADLAGAGPGADGPRRRRPPRGERGGGSPDRSDGPVRPPCSARPGTRCCWTAAR